MEDTTKNMMLALAGGIVKKGLLTLSASAVTHGLINGNQTELFVSGGMLLATAAYSFWNDYGKAIVVSQLEVLKAKSLAQAAKMKANGVRPVSVSEIAAQSPTLTETSVTKVIAALPPQVAANITPTPTVLK